MPVGAILGWVCPRFSDGRRQLDEQCLAAGREDVGELGCSAALSDSVPVAAQVGGRDDHPAQVLDGLGPTPAPGCVQVQRAQG
jgi:hypothetical protein